MIIIEKMMVSTPLKNMSSSNWIIPTLGENNIHLPNHQPVMYLSHVIIMYPLLNVYIANWKITMLLMGKSTISTGPCSIANCLFTRPGTWAIGVPSRHQSRTARTLFLRFLRLLFTLAELPRLVAPRHPFINIVQKPSVFNITQYYTSNPQTF